ncbi:helix-turn-helix transcriptional regulator [Phaeacidiphilus oryzae]|uniref:helix-turn-helix transcriptional regulator n=1 Tax=Phaeacidiphilus oryzae TaxID=348818 RepID=UPI001F2F887D|nr:helix-turn-helix domain-containing protein [Phaeacidiphilus oryzae]
MDQRPGGRDSWTFLTNHARVLAAIARNPDSRVRDIAQHCLLTERAVQRIIVDLEEGGYLAHTRSGRTNIYRLSVDSELRHPADAGARVADLLNILNTHEQESTQTLDRVDGGGPGGARESRAPQVEP